MTENQPNQPQNNDHLVTETSQSQAGLQKQQNKVIKTNQKVLSSAVDKPTIQPTNTTNNLTQVKPSLLNVSKANYNLLKSSCLKNNKVMVSSMLDEAQKDVSAPEQNYICDAIIESIRLQKLQMVKIFVDKGFDIKKVVFNKNELSLTSLDFAILGGHYQIAKYIYDQIKTNNNLKDIQQYYKIGKKYSYRYVNYHMVVDGLVNNVAKQKIGNYLKKQISSQRKQKIKRIYQEGCCAFLMRIFGSSNKNKQYTKDKKMNNKDNSVSASGANLMQPYPAYLNTDKPLQQPNHNN